MLHGFKDQGYKKDGIDDPLDNVFSEKFKNKQMLKECDENYEKDKKIEPSAFEIEDVICTVKKLNIT